MTLIDQAKDLLNFIETQPKYGRDAVDFYFMKKKVNTKKDWYLNENGVLYKHLVEPECEISFITENNVLKINVKKKDDG